MTKIKFPREKSEVKKMYWILRVETYGRKPFWLKLIRFAMVRGLLK